VLGTDTLCMSTEDSETSREHERVDTIDLADVPEGFFRKSGSATSQTGSEDQSESAPAIAEGGGRGQEEEDPEEEANGSGEAGRLSQGSNSLAVLVPHFNRRFDDDEFNALATHADRAFALLAQISQLVGTETSQLVSNSDYTVGTVMTRPDAPVHPLDDFELVVPFTRVHTNGQEYVPAGPCNATRLGMGTYGADGLASFPHILAKTPRGEHLWVLEASKKVGVKAMLVNKRHTGHRVTEKHVLDLFNSTLPEGSPPLRSLEFQMRLLFAHHDESGFNAVPVGVGMSKTFKKPLSSGCYPPFTQLLDPPELSKSLDDDEPKLTSAYRKVMTGGCVAFPFKVRGACTSNMAMPKHSKFVVQVSAVDPRLRRFNAQSEPFLITSKFFSSSSNDEAGERGRLERGEVYYRSTEDGAPVKVRVRKRSRVEQTA